MKPSLSLESLEQDRDDAKLARAEPSAELLLPAEVWTLDAFSFAFSRAVFDGWAHQPSPCCAAASVAGACNAALGLSATSADALSSAHVAGLLHGMLSEQAAKRRAAVERLLGGVPIEPAIQALRAELSAEGRTLGGRKEAGCKPKEALGRLRRLASAHQSDTDSAAAAEAAETWRALRAAFAAVSAAAAEGDDEADEGDNEGAAGDEALLVDPFAKEGGAPDPGLGARRELRILLSKLAGAEQLGACQQRPSTAAVGNWGITGAVKALRDGRFADWRADPRLEALACARPHSAGQSGAENAPPAEQTGDPEAATPLHAAVRGAARLSARTLASVRVRGQPAPPIVLSRRDTDAEVQAAWLSLRAAFSRPRCALVLHHRNHYALIFGMREWTQAAAGETGGGADPGPVAPDPGAERAGCAARVRQVLSARKGQRPTAWLDWSEVHRTLSGWAGYAIIEVAAAADERNELA